MIFRKLALRTAGWAPVLLLPVVVHSHTAWIGSSRYTVEEFTPELPAATANLFFGWGEVPPVQDFIRDGSRIERFVMRHPDARLQTLTPGGSGYRAVEVPLPTRGTYMIGASIKPYFHTYAEQNGQVVALSQPRSALPRGTPVFESQFRRIFAKTILTVGREDATSADVSQPLDHALEIVPLAHPAKLRPGDSLPFEVRYQGRPLDVMRLESRPIVRANYVGFSQREEYPWAGELDEKGRGLLPLRVPGVWLILVEQHFPWREGHDRDAREEVLKASLMFEVR